MRSVPIYKLEFSKTFRKEFARGCEKIFSSDSLTNGNFVEQFEKGFAKFIDVPHAIATYSGTSALEISLRSIGIANKEVIVPTNTFVASAIAVERAGGKLVLADVEPETFALSPKDLERKISKKTGAVMIVHIGGVISQYIKEIVSLCKKYQLPLIEDAAHAHGSTRGNYRAGSIGTLACFSFFPTKVMTTGEGGMVVTHDKKMADLVRSLRNFGRDPVDSHIMVTKGGSNHKMTEFQGLLGTLELKRVKARIKKRTLIAHQYIRNLKSTTFQPIIVRNGVNSYYKLILRTPLPQKKLHEFCKKYYISLTGEVYHILVHEQPIYKSQFNTTDYPVANEIARHHICPPVYPEMTLADVNYVCTVLKKAEKVYL